MPVPGGIHLRPRQTRSKAAHIHSAWQQEEETHQTLADSPGKAPVYTLEKPPSQSPGQHVCCPYKRSCGC